MRVKHLAMWILCLGSGGLVGIVMLPVELFIMGLARCLGAKDVTWSEFGFIFRQFTDLRTLRELYPLAR